MPDRYEGGCHCGGVRFEYLTHVAPSAWNVRACQCSFCRAHHGITTSDPDSDVEFTEVVAGSLSRYRFGQRTADFLICARCGVYVGVLMETAEGSRGIINTNALASVPSDMAVPQSKDFSGETPDARIARRQRNWSHARLTVT